MANVNPASAIAAYSSTARAAMPQATAEGIQQAPVGPTFSSLVTSAAESALQTSKTAESMSMQAVAGNAEMSDVVTAVANAEVTLQTVVSVRDRVVAAYQDIIKMPI
jgi:flagellar hook-basal body complex protein FliE